MPGITHWQSPNFFAYFPSNSSGPSILGDLLSSGLGVQGMLWATSPSCTELETRVLDWLADMLQLPDKFKSISTAPPVEIDLNLSGSCSISASQSKTRVSSSVHEAVSYTHLRAHETRHDLVCRLL